MRLNHKDLPFRVRAAAEAPHPIRMQIAGLTFGLTAAEAIRLATLLADTVAEVKEHTGPPRALEFFDTTERTKPHE